ncbi:MAG: phosphoribosylformylglycinamidine synthase subunit PurL [Candidatus Bathyarchaeota archaeon]|nr:phosphoribosylformylglycinamidine synthase subunit PurL [Candidatus Bathyarchaeota archaeon]
MRSNLYIQRKEKSKLYEIDLAKASDKELSEISFEIGLGLSLKEMKKVQKYFKKQGRNPTHLEMETIAQTWSEHCCHKTFKGTIIINNKEIKSLLKTFIARVTKELDPDWCFSVFEDNAGIVHFDKDYGIAAKVETHNHPSAVEPFGGAATGVGGVIRDVLGVWADPIACTDVLGFGPLDYDYKKLPFGVKHPKYVYMGVTAGISAYGNNMGIPTVNGAIYFDESYTGNVIVYCGCLGLVPLNKFRKNAKPNDIILLVGGKTGRDGIHGVTFASSELTEESESVSRPAVQIADPIQEEKVKRAIIEVRDRELASAITDLGGGGLSSAVGETAERFNCGAIIELQKVSLKNQDLAPWEIYISESQERMLLIVPPENLEKTLEIFLKEEVNATAIGKLTSDRHLRLYYQTEKAADLDMSFTFMPPESQKKAIYKKPKVYEPVFAEPENLTKILLQILSTPNVASKERVIRTYDHEVKGNTTLKPLQGKYSGPNDAAVIKPLNRSWKGIVISCGMNPKYGKIDPYWMAASAIDEAVRNNIAVGGRRIALLDNFTWGNPEKEERLGSLVKACEACYDIASALGTPFISGKDSLYNESPLGPVTPTLLISALGIIPDIRKTVSMDIKKPENSLYIVGNTFDELGGSEYYSLKGYIGKNVPKVRTTQASNNFNAITKAIDSNLISACHDISEGGLAVSAAEMAFTGGYGITIDLAKVPNENLSRNDVILFSESNSRFLVEANKKSKDAFEYLMKGKSYAEIGKITEKPNFLIKGLNGAIIIDTLIQDLQRSWKETLSGGL